MSAFLTIAAARAQGVGEGMQEAQARIDAEDLNGALDLLLPLVKAEATRPEQEHLAERFEEVGRRLQEVAAFERALLAHETALTMWKRLFADADHPDVAMTLVNAAACLQSLGRADEALPQYEAALAMRKRLFGEADHADVAWSLGGVASCLSSLGRAREALPQFEAALAMYKRLFGETDHPDVATSLNNVAFGLHSLGRADEALPRYEAALAMRKRLFGEADHADVAWSLGNVASCLDSLGRANEALPQYEAALAMRKRLFGEAAHPDLSMSLNNLASCLHSLGRVGEALPQFEAALAINRRLFGEADHPRVAAGLHNVASCLDSLSRFDEALPQFEAALAMRKRLFGQADHPEVATSMNSVAGCLNRLGRVGEALPQQEAALAMYRRLFGDADHPEVAMSLSNLATYLSSLGRVSEALPQYEAALGMHKRLAREADHPDVARSLENVAFALLSLGRAGEALPQDEAALAMFQRLFAGADHIYVATCLDGVARCLMTLGRANEALPRYEAALAMFKRLCGDADHLHVARSLGNMASCLDSLGRADEALPQYEAALAMYKRLFGDADHPDVATSQSNMASCLNSLGRANEALPQYEAALAMYKRLFGQEDHPHMAASLGSMAVCLHLLGREGEALSHYEVTLAMYKRMFGTADHPVVATTLRNVAVCLEALGRAEDAVPLCTEACDMIERLRDQSETSPDLRQSFFDAMKRCGAFERLQALSVSRDTASALSAAERSRGRDLLDLLEQQLFDPLEEAERRSQRRGDHEAARRLQQLRSELAAVTLESDRRLHELTRFDHAAFPSADRETRRAALLAQFDEVTTRKRQLLDERARQLGDVLPVGRVRKAAEIQSVLREGELLLEFTLTAEVALLYLLARDGTLDVIELPTAHATTQRALTVLLQHSSRAQVRGRDPEAPGSTVGTDISRDLFASLFPPAAWERIRLSKRVFVAAHRELHRLPLELLVTDVKDGKPVYWIDSGPEIAYVPSGSVLHWLRTRETDSTGATELDLLAIGDPSTLAPQVVIPERGVFVVAVQPGGQGERIGLQPRDVLLRYDGKEIADQAALGPLRQLTEAAITNGSRTDSPIPIELWRAGETLQLEVQKGALGIQVARSNPRLAFEGSLGTEEQTERILRHGDLERVRQLPRLAGAEAEAKAIGAAWLAKDKKVAVLLNEQATEPAVFDFAGEAKHLHFACHGIAEEYAGQSLSMLVLSQPERLQDGNDGLLKLDDLLHRWRGRLEGCRLVVLSACRTNVGPTLRDDAPQALPLGFLFAGVPSVISTLWAVDDASTRDLMVDFYSRLGTGESDKLAAFTAAKKALRQRYPAPFHWAPFLFMGRPE